jgi:hypothetical protein
MIKLINWVLAATLIGGGSLNANGGNGGFGGAASNIGTGVAAASRSPHAQACILIMV